MRRILLLLCVFGAYLTLNAESVSKSEALKKAQGFMPGKHFSESRSVASVRGEVSSEAFYVFNADNDGGFVIVSGDDRTTEILGYSKTGNLDMDHLPENLKWWLDGYARQIDALGTSVKPALTQKSITRGSDSRKAIQPLIQTKWNQDYPYNMMCPDYQGRFVGDDGFATDSEGAYDTDNICVTGCVATAMAQIMYYWKYPDTCPTLASYNTYTHGWPMNTLPAISFNWDAMKKSYNGNETDESAEAIATLFRYCGQSVEMNYDIGGSEASVSPSVLANVFGYSKNIRSLYRDAYTTSQWEEIIYAELAAQRPVFYSGQADVGGHQFIIDGYDGNGLFHMNWGWGGMSDDYFVLSLADPHSQGIGGSATNTAFQFGQEALIGVKPGSSEEVLTAQIESRISAMTTKEYTRVSTTEDFTGVQFNGAFYARYTTASTEALNVQVGWALCQNGEIKKVVSSKLYTVDAGVTSDNRYTNTTSSFGAGLALGKYEVCQVYRYSDDAAWSLCAPYWRVDPNFRTSFLMADVTETSLTVRQVQPSFQVNSITVPEYPSTGSSLDVTLNVTNDGETFEQVIKLLAQKEGESTWTPVAATTRKIDPGKSGDVVMSYTPTMSGTFTLKATNGTTNEALKTATVTIYSSIEKTIDNIKYVCHSGTKKAKVVGNTLSGTSLSVSIPATIVDNGITYTVSEIDDRAFMYCYRLSEISIPEGVMRIGEKAFLYCYALKKVSLPSTLQSIGDEAFAYDDNLETLLVAMTSPCAIDRSVFIIEEEVEGESVEVFSKANLYVPIGKKTVYASADVWKEFPVIYQGELKETIVNGITYTYVTGEEFAIVKKGDQTALENQDVVIPSTISVAGKTYNVKKIGDYAFSQVYMNSLTIQPGVEEIGKGAFWNVYSIKQIIIPSGVKFIGAEAFRYCYLLKTIELPASLKSIGEYAFGNLSYLESVVSYITDPFDIADNVFGIVNGDVLTAPTVTLSVPAGTKGKYEATDGWKKFQTTTEMPAQTAVPGDVSGNGTVGPEDLNLIVGYIMAGEYNDKADLNNDKNVNAADIVEYVKISKK